MTVEFRVEFIIWSVPPEFLPFPPLCIGVLFRKASYATKISEFLALLAMFKYFSRSDNLNPEPLTC